MPKSTIRCRYLILYKDGHWASETAEVPVDSIASAVRLESAYKKAHTTLHMKNIEKVVPEGPVNPDDADNIPGTHKKLKTPKLFNIHFTEEFETIVEAWDRDHAVERFEEESLAGDEERRKYIRSQVECIDLQKDITGADDESLQETLIHRIAYPDPSVVLERLLEYLVSEAMDDPQWHLKSLYRKFADEMFGEGTLNKINELKSRYYDVFKEMMHAEWRKLQEEDDE